MIELIPKQLRVCSDCIAGCQCWVDKTWNKEKNNENK